MSTKTRVLDVIDSYNALSVPDQTVLQALSALYEPAAAPVVSSCLNGAGLRESPLRAFSPQIVAIRLGRLVKAGFVQERTEEVRGQKIRLWTCLPEAGEIALRHAVRDGRFQPMAKAAISQTRGRDWGGNGADDSLRRRLRLSFHGGDADAAATDFLALAAEHRGEAGTFLAALIRSQPDDSWRRDMATPGLARLTAAALEDTLAGLGDPGPLEALARDMAARNSAGRETEELIPPLADIMTLRGKNRDAAQIAAMATDEEIRLAASIAPALAENSADAVSLAEAATARRRSRLGARDTLLPGTGAIWQTLAVMTGDVPEAVEAMLRRLAAPAAQTHPLVGALACLRHVLLFMTGQAFAAKTIPDEPPDRHPLTILMHALCLLRIDPERLPPLADDLTRTARRAQERGYRWLARQFHAVAAGALGKKGEDENGAEWKASLAALFQGDEEWRRGLRALAELAVDAGGAGEGPEKRLAWVVNFPEQPADPYVPCEIQPVEQTLGKNGLWSKGRNIALKRIFQRAGDLAFASDQDRLIFSAVRLEHDGFFTGYRFEPAAALPLLAGHPLVFRSDGNGARLDVTAGEFELAVTERDGGCEIAMMPALSEFLPDNAPSGGNAGDAAGDELPEAVARLETPTRLRVLRLGNRERRLARVVGEGLIIPARGREETLAALSRLAGSIRIHSDIPGLAGEATPVEADPRPHFHVMPLVPGLKVEIWCHPLGDNGPAYRPGKGGKILTAEMDGRTVRTSRNAKKERELAEEAIRACPSLAEHADGDLSWRLENPEDALTFLGETEDIRDKIVLAWPKGGRMRVRRIQGTGALSLRISSSAEWFEVDGRLRVDENLTIDMGRILASLRASAGRFVEIGEGEYLALTNGLRQQLGDLEAMGEFHGDTFRLPAMAEEIIEGLEESGADLAADAAWRLRLERRQGLTEFSPDPPADFRGELRDYQLEGYRWMARLAEWGAGACLADDMGLGKTVQTLAMLARRAKLGPALVVAPTSVCHNWITEATRFAPNLRFIQFGEGDREKILTALGPGDALIASYSLLRQEEKLFAGVKWATAVLDEAQAIKNIAAKRSRAAMALDAGFRLITTGTPIENRLGELWNLFRFINPRLLGSWRRFQERFAIPIERLKDKAAGDRLRRIIRPFILRRTKSQVLDSLPPKTEITLTVELGDKERAFYESLRRNALERLEDPTGAPENRRFQILAEIMRLRRACCSPDLAVPGSGIPSAKQEQFRATLMNLVENNHKVLVFSQFVDHLAIIRRVLDEEGISYQYLDGSTPAKNRKKAVEDFQAGRGDVFLISLKAGGLGLNLTAADYVIHMDPWWNPAVEDQASDRAHRIGQNKPVTVYRLVAAGTIEEKIVKLHQEKRRLADTLLADADQAAGLDMAEIMRLLREQ